MSGPYYSDSSVTVLAGNCLDVLPTLAAESVDAVVTDPPYALSFMGKAWDVAGVAFDPATWREVARVLKPGGHLLAFGGTRTYHRLACAIEDAGFEIRDSIAWLYGSGFPKSTRVGRDERYCHCDASARTSSRTSHELGTADRTRTADASAAAEGAARSAHRATSEPLGSPDGCHPVPGSGDALPRPVEASDPASPLPQGCAPARTRSDVLADGPVDGSSRSPSPALGSDHPSSLDSGHPSRSHVGGQSRRQGSTSPAGTSGLGYRTPGSRLSSSRSYGTGFPLCSTCDKPIVDGLGTALKPAHEPIVVARKSTVGTVAGNVAEHGTGALNIDACRVGDDTSRGDRYNGKPPSPTGSSGGQSSLGVFGPRPDNWAVQPGRWPTNVVLDESQAEALDAQTGVLTSGGGDRRSNARHVLENRLDRDNDTPRIHDADSGGASRFFPTFRYEAKAPTYERPSVDDVLHPTVKPLDLMRWLVRLVTPPGGLVLDPFLGSGTTAEACILENLHCIGIEREPDYLPLIVQRISKPLAVGFDFGEAAG